MNIAIAQIESFVGDLTKNIANHVSLVELALAQSADVVVFPELSLVGYEPAIAADATVEVSDRRLSVFQDLSDANRISIGVGAPTVLATGVGISLLLFQPNQPRRVYSKMHLHSDEEAFFVCGPQVSGIVGAERQIALAICYELSVPEHAANAAANGAKIYIASVAKTDLGIEKALKRLSEIARVHSMAVLMSNGIGETDGCRWAGRSSAWNSDGELLAQLDETSQGVIVVDTETSQVTLVKAPRDLRH